MPPIIASPRGAATATFLAFGIALGLWSGALPTVARTAGVGPLGLGIVITILTGAYILAMAAGGAVLVRMSTRRLVLLSGPALAIVLVAALMAPNPVLLGLLAGLLGAGFGIVDLAMNAEGTRVESDLGRPILASLHAAASFGMACGAITGSLTAHALGPWSAGGIGAAALAFGLVLVRRCTPERPPAAARDGSGGSGLVIAAPLVAIGIVVGISIAGETAAHMWSGRLLEEQAPALAAYAGLGAAFFAAFQSMIRFAGDRLRRLAGDRTLLAGSMVVAASGFLVIAAFGSFAGSILGFALVGAGTALIVPCSFALAVAHAPAAAAAALSTVSLIAGLPRLAAPYAFGEIAARASIGTAFGLAGAVFLMALGVVAAIGRSKRAGIA